MEIELYASDPFTGKKDELLSRFSSDYRFQKDDELYVHAAGGQGAGGRPLKVRLIDVRVHVHDDGRLTAELLALKL